MFKFRPSLQPRSLLLLLLLSGGTQISRPIYAEESLTERFSFTLKAESQELEITDLVTGESHQLFENTTIPQRDTSAGQLFSDKEPHQSISEARVIVRVLRPQEHLPPKFRLTKYEPK